MVCLLVLLVFQAVLGILYQLVRTHLDLAKSEAFDFARFLHGSTSQQYLLVLLAFLFHHLPVCDVDLLYLNVLAVTFESQKLGSFACPDFQSSNPVADHACRSVVVPKPSQDQTK